MSASPIFFVFFTWLGWFLASLLRLCLLRGDDARGQKVAELEAVTFYASGLVISFWLYWGRE